MHIRHQCRKLGVSGKQIVVHIAWVAGRITKAKNAGYLCKPAQQISQRRRSAIKPRAMVGIYVLSDQRHLAYASLGESLDFVHDLSTGRETSAPRVYGTTQNVQNLSQPSCTVTKADTPRARIASRAGGLSTSNLSSTGNSVSTTAPSRSARASRSGRR